MYRASFMQQCEAIETIKLHVKLQQNLQNTLVVFLQYVSEVSYILFIVSALRQTLFSELLHVAFTSLISINAVYSDERGKLL